MIHFVYHTGVKLVSIAQPGDSTNLPTLPTSTQPCRQLCLLGHLGSAKREQGDEWEGSMRELFHLLRMRFVNHLNAARVAPCHHNCLVFVPFEFLRLSSVIFALFSLLQGREAGFGLAGTPFSCLDRVICALQISH